MGRDGKVVPGPHTNRRSCFILVAVLAILVAAIAFVGFNGKPESNSVAHIPVM